MNERAITSQRKIMTIEQNEGSAVAALNWLQENSDHIHFSKSVTGKNVRMWSSKTGEQVVAPTLIECIAKYQTVIE